MGKRLMLSRGMSAARLLVLVVGNRRFIGDSWLRTTKGMG